MAIAAVRFDRPSETFIRRHVSGLLPGETCLIATEQNRPDPVHADYPAFWFSNFFDVRPYLRSAMRTSPLTEFLLRRGCRVVLAEYGPVGKTVLRHARSANARLYVHFHGYDATSYIRSPRRRRSFQNLFEQADGFIAPSQFIRDRLAEAGCPSERITVVPGGVDAREFEPSSREPGHLLAVGRFVEKKAPLTTLKAFARASQKLNHLRLDFVGEGPLLEAAKKQATSDGIESKVRFHGALAHDGVRELMRSAELFLQHSVTARDGNTEGLPVAILEAMCSGVPVISTRHSGIPEAVVEGETGLLTDEHDVDGMAKAIVDFACASRERMNTFSEAARQRALAEFSAERSLSELRSAIGL